MKFLPIAAAVLLATSCGKDDNSAAVDEEVTPIEEEVYDSNVKTITITGKVGKESLSKVTVSSGNLAFQKNDEFTFGTTGANNVYGSIKITATDGSYTATVSYPNETALLDESGFMATLGTEPTGLSSAYTSLETAVSRAYYEVPFKVTKESEGVYALETTVSGKTGDILVYIKSAFIKTAGAGTTKLNGESITVEAGRFYVIPVGVTMGSGTKVTEAGKVYKFGMEGLLGGKFSVAEGKQVQFSKGNLQCKTLTSIGFGYECRFAENQYDVIGNASANTDLKGAMDHENDDWYDLFGWGMWVKGESPDMYPKDNKYYVAGVEDAGEFVNISRIGSEWKTLSNVQWHYLLNTRTTTKGIKYVKATVHNVNGLILLPDNWNGTYSFTNPNSSSATFETISNSSWTTLENEGAVFLPMAGGRENATVTMTSGYYWSSTAYNADQAYSLYFNSSSLSTPGSHYTNRYVGCAVRLVYGLTIATSKSGKAGFVDDSLVEEDFE